MKYKNLLFTHEDGIAILSFNRPDVLNAINIELLEEMFIILKDIEKNEKIRALIITGNSKKAFVAGADIVELASLNGLQSKIFTTKGQKIISFLQDLSIPVIAAVNGFALGGGCEIALACDFIYASNNALFGLPEINLGIIPGFGGTQRLPRLVGINIAKEMIFTGKLLEASEAYRIGLINKICGLDNLIEDTVKTAKVIANKGMISMRAAKQSINNGLNIDLASGCKFEIESFAICMTSPDAKEGTSAFIEKRKPKFKSTINY